MPLVFIFVMATKFQEHLPIIILALRNSYQNVISIFFDIQHKIPQITLIITKAFLVQLTILQYFYRTSHRERFSSLQFSKAFLGFPDYNYYLHAFLVLLNTYGPHLIGMTSLFYLFNKQTTLGACRIIMSLQVLQLLCSSIMCEVTKKELMFPQRTAPKYVFDVFQYGVIFLINLGYQLVTEVTTVAQEAAIKKK